MARNWQNQTTRIDFSEFNEERVAIQLPQLVFCGVASFQRDDTLGNVLRISGLKAEPGAPEIILTENDWDGRIIPDLKNGCHFCFIPTADSFSS